jgi:hypothetical protein
MKAAIGHYLTALCLLPWLACVGEIVGTGASPDAGDLAPTDGGGDHQPDAQQAGTPDAASSERAFAAGIGLREISLYQSVEIPLVSAGAAVGQRNAPVVEGAEALIAAFVDVAAGWQARDIVGELTIENGNQTEVYTHTRNVLNDSTTNVASAFRFEVAGADITTATRFAVTLYEAAPGEHAGSTSGARFPATGTSALGAQSPHGPFHLVLVPFQYDADGSHRLPPVTGSALQEYRDRFLAMYPVGEVEVTVRSAVAYGSTIGATSGWENWLDRLTEIREQDNPPDNTFYFGVAAPADTFYGFCSNGCIAGLGWVPDRDSNYLQAAVGVSFSGDVNVYTSLHEVGHTLGRSHTPCGNPSGIDPSYPYSNGGVGVWGYDAVIAELKDPAVYTDIMGYCEDQWISDYTYEGIFERIAYVNQQASFRAAAPAQRYRVGLVDAGGRVAWRRYTELSRPLVGNPIEIALLDRGAERERITGHFFPYDHLPGGMLMVPVPDRAPTAIRADGLPVATW